MRGGIAHQPQAQPSTMLSVATCLARSGTERLARQSRTIGPKCGCASSQVSQRTLPREKHHAASSTKGAVGSSGKKMPTMPASKKVAAAVLLLLLSLAALSASWIAPDGGQMQFRDHINEPPSSQFPLGTDPLGRRRFQ